MWAYIIRRLLLAIPTTLGVTLLVFVVMRIAPGDVALAMLGGEGMIGREEELEKLREELGLKRPLYIQYGDWLWSFVRGDFGESYFYRQPNSFLIGRKFPLSAQVGLMAIVIGVTIAIPGGIISALKQDTAWDYILRVFSIIGLSIPTFWSGMLLLLLLIRFFGWIPEQGYIPLWDDPLRNLGQLIFPASVVGYSLSAVPLRMTRSTMLEVLREDYIRTARAKGLAERVVIIRHALRNALIPVVTLIALFIPVTVGGLVVTEQVFALPGIGRMMVQGITNRDYPVVQIIVTMVGVTIVMTNLFVDLLYGWLDPRIRY
ncbi:MAG: ABC transporter permease [Chloroflexi bacterium]|nr:ABC transporter permease [Chloroflexota bacterium]